MDSKIDLGVLEGVPVVLEVELGHREIFLGELLRLERGSVVELPQAAGGPLGIYVGGSRLGRAKVLARGRNRTVEVIEVGDVQ